MTLRGGVDGGDGKRFRARGCGVLVVWENAGSVCCEMMLWSRERGECCWECSGVLMPNTGVCVKEVRGGVGGSLGSTGEPMILCDIVQWGRRRRERVEVVRRGGCVDGMLGGQNGS